MKPKIVNLLWVTFLLAPCAAEVQGEVAFQHRGNVNPTTENFTLVGGQNNTVLIPIVGDQGYDSWKIQNPSGVAFYTGNLTDEQTDQALSSGWIMSLRLRVLQPVGQEEVFSFASFTTGTDYYSLGFGIQVNGKSIVAIGTSSGYLRYSLNGTGYHQYELKSAANGMASLWADGVELNGGFMGVSYPNSPKQFAWGAGQRRTTEANWNEATFTIVPEPTSFALFLAGGMLAAKKLIRRFRARAISESEL